MRHLLLMLLTALTWTHTQAQQQEVTFTANDQKWAVNSTATGKLVRSGPFLNVTLDRLTMRVNADYKPGPVKILHFKIGLASATSGGQWRVIRWTEEVPQEITLLPGQTRLIENYRGVIPVDGIADLPNHWLVLAVETSINGTVGSNYSRGLPGLGGIYR